MVSWVQIQKKCREKSSELSRKARVQESYNYSFSRKPARNDQYPEKLAGHHQNASWKNKNNRRKVARSWSLNQKL